MNNYPVYSLPFTCSHIF